MQVIVQAIHSKKKFLVELENDYIVSYSETSNEIPDSEPNFLNHYFQIKEILPDRCNGWVVV